MSATFADVICKNIDTLSDASRRGNQRYVDQYLDTFFLYSERASGRSGLDERPRAKVEPQQASLNL